MIRNLKKILVNRKFFTVDKINLNGKLLWVPTLKVNQLLNYSDCSDECSGIKKIPACPSKMKKKKKKPKLCPPKPCPTVMHACIEDDCPYVPPKCEKPCLVKPRTKKGTIIEEINEKDC